MVARARWHARLTYHEPHEHLQGRRRNVLRGGARANPTLARTTHTSSAVSTRCEYLHAERRQQASTIEQIERARHDVCTLAHNLSGENLALRGGARVRTDAEGGAKSARATHGAHGCAFGMR